MDDVIEIEGLQMVLMGPTESPEAEDSGKDEDEIENEEDANER